MQQNESALHVHVFPPFGHPSHSCLHSALRRGPCAKQYVLISYLFYERKIFVLSGVRLFTTSWTSLPSSSVHVFFQARILEWGAIPSQRNLPHPGMEPRSFVSPAFLGRFFTTQHHLGSPSILYIVSMVYMCQSQSPNSSHLTSFPPDIHTFILYMCLYFCFVNKIIYTFF